MELKARCCLKCGREIIGAKGDILHLFVQHYFSLDNGNYIAAAFCNQCSITPDDYEPLQKALGLEVKILNVVRKKTLKDIVMEKQGDICALCGQKITTLDVEVMPGHAVRHISCPAPIVTEEVKSSPGKIAAEYRERNKRRRAYSV